MAEAGGGLLVAAGFAAPLGAGISIGAFLGIAIAGHSTAAARDDAHVRLLVDGTDVTAYAELRRSDRVV